jgi:hypothetical protein
MPTRRLAIEDFLHATNLRHGTDGFTSPPKEGVQRIFSPLEIRRFRPGLNPTGAASMTIVELNSF